MSRAGRTGLTLAAILAAGAGGYWAGQREIALPPITWLRAVPSFRMLHPGKRMPDRLRPGQ
jgi:membrane fusion protein, copper/silver efflux system